MRMVEYFLKLNYGHYPSVFLQNRSQSLFHKWASRETSARLGLSKKKNLDQYSYMYRFSYQLISNPFAPGLCDSLHGFSYWLSGWFAIGNIFLPNSYNCVHNFNYQLNYWLDIKNISSPDLFVVISISLSMNQFITKSFFGKSCEILTIDLACNLIIISRF